MYTQPMHPNTELGHTPILSIWRKINEREQQDTQVSMSDVQEETEKDSTSDSA